MKDDDASVPQGGKPLGANSAPSISRSRPIAGSSEPESSLCGPLAMVRVGRGDRTAFQGIYETYKQNIYAFLVRMVADSGAAEDLLQETFMRVYQEAVRYDPCRPLEPWIFRIARNLAVDHLRSRKRKKMVSLSGTEENFLDAEDSSPGPIDHATFRERETLLRVGLQKLRPSQREIFVLVDLEGHKYEEVADHLGISVKAVGARLRKARRRFLNWAKPNEKRLLGERGDSEEP